ncbi:MAG: hypothetical protein QOI16_2270 [Pseudonocardiales bacterium]|nr:hypothetical protein [Pseudonocardiales bacterium]
MPSEIREWSVPAPLRALLWWPAISFVLVVVAPDAATGAIVGAGAVLALLGTALSALARRIRRDPLVDAPTIEFPTMEMPPVPGDRAA